MKKRRLKITAVSMMLASGLMLASCGIAEGVADAVNEIVSDAAQMATAIAFDEMGGGPVVTLAVGDMFDGDDLFVSLANNAVNIQTHADSTIRIEFSPPTTGEYQIPTVAYDVGGRIEITEPPDNLVLDRNHRPGILYVYRPQGIAANNMELRTLNGAVRIVGNDHLRASSVEITVVNGMVELRNFNAPNISVRSTNGTISGSGLETRNLTLNAINGIITLRDSQISGDLTARTLNGGITIENVDADMDRADINAVNGVVTVR
ncbi:MAG: DUF4097 domain-containing protein [Clostridiales bacterium]|jgi:hypothetical protein|nr:DUF4097 domain-containing protein [Clostridiales bacterium]